MSFTSTDFLFLFLPVSLLAYYLAGKRIREYVLVIISMIFYAYASADFILLLMFSIIVNVLLGRNMRKFSSKDKKAALIIGIIFNAAILIYYKYANFALSTFAKITHMDVKLLNLLMPLGVSFFTFKSISYLIDVYHETADLSKSPIHDVLYLSFFGQIISGPLSRYNDMDNQEIIAKSGSERFNHFSEGVYRFIIGFNKKVLIADVLSNITNEIFSTPIENLATSLAWLGSICYSMQLFFDFAGYSDMAIGLSKMFGYDCEENFIYPYMTESVSKFWRRWHISLSSWFRDYIYIPMGGSRTKKQRIYINLLVVWLLTGFWHGASWNFVVWGLGYFVLIAFERLTKLPEKIKSKPGKIVYRVFTLLFINFEWVIFRLERISNGFGYIKRMLIVSSTPFVNERFLFLLKDYFVFVLFAILLCFPVIPFLEKKSDSKVYKNVFGFISIAVNLMLFIWAISFIIGGQNHPFAYADF